jgi:outer membrane protein OmpA-like peptidoglycan-associated protein
MRFQLRSRLLRIGCALALSACAAASSPPPKSPSVIAEFPPPPRDRDTDCDGVADVDDACPTAAEDRDGFQDDDGCPDPDNDHDNIPDECDQCPDEPETYNGIVDEDGCPDVGRIQIMPSEIRILQHVFFGPGSAQIRPESRPLIEEIARVMKENPQIERIATLGHTSSDEAGAQRLSERRAEAVRSALIALGLDPPRIEAHGYGATRPLVPNTRPADREKNRRTELYILRANGQDLRSWNGKDLADIPQPDPPPVARQMPRRPIEPCIPRVIPPLPSKPCRADPQSKSKPVELRQ